ncbi:hypothetical protein PV08_02501 [Exophiala spinifera]|uniref:Uncharacterized protein n=1 Tax=Exophiala spinifera TaxID=91928 RepID=A0A0D2BGS9_9EURO|nr:uncharacterized protein PV08_02501 [Exophiala spinifera]KIW18213.1 hypothetical protein PV08_02501 [Exophiala spinifera]
MSEISVIVTGGASGIGLANVRKLAGKWLAVKTHISILDINTQQGEQIVNSLKNEFSSSGHTTFTFHRCDVASWDSLAEAFTDIFTVQRRIDIVFANAGVAEKGAFMEPSNKPTKPNMLCCDINFYGVLNTVNLAIHYMNKNQISTRNGLRGSIICTASNSGLYAFPLEPMYAAAKHGVVGLVRSLGPRLAQGKIQINGLAPCVVETNIAPGVGQLDGIILTPLSTVVKAVEMILDDASISGQIAEISEDRVTWPKQQDYVDDSTRKNYGILCTLVEGATSA